MSQIHGWPGACLPTHLLHTCLISTLSTDLSCVFPPQFCTHPANMSPSRVQIKTSEMGPSRFVYLRADSGHRESKRKYWYKLKAGKPGKQLPPKYKRMFSNKQIVCIEYMEITEDNEREIFRVRYLLPTFYYYYSPSFLQISEYNLAWLSITPRR